MRTSPSSRTARLPRQLLSFAALASLACVPLETPRDVMGNFEVSYEDNLRVFIDDELVATVTSGEEESFEWNGEIIEISTLCSDEGVDCPAESFWGEVAVDQPWGSGYKLLNFVNLDQEHGTPGARLGGLMEEDGSYTMLSGLGLSANENCAVLGVGTVTGTFDENAEAMENGVIAYAWAAGCDVGGVTISSSLRLETDFTATRTGDYDVSSVDPEDPIDEEGETVDPEDPDEGYGFEESGGDTGTAGAYETGDTGW